jgi:hypothetical protein
LTETLGGNLFWKKGFPPRPPCGQAPASKKLYTLNHQMEYRFDSGLQYFKSKNPDETL